MSFDEILKYDANQPRDERGRFAAAGDKAGAALALAGAAQDRSVETRTTLRDLGQKAIAALHDRAVELAGKARHVITSTRFAGASPIQGGGVELRATHGLSERNSGYLASYAQIYPWQVQHPAGQRILANVHNGLVGAGRRLVPARHPSVGVDFKNGPSP